MNTNRPRTVALNVKAAIIASGLTVEEAARAIHTPPSTLRRHLDRGDLTVPELTALSEVTGEPITAFFATSTRQRTAA